MPDSGVSWLHSAGLGSGETGIFSFSVNNFSFLHQFSNEHADGAVVGCITHSIHAYNNIVTQAFLLMTELQMCGRVIFPLTENHDFDSNSAAIKALGLNPLLSHSLTLFYIILE